MQEAQSEQGSKKIAAAVVDPHKVDMLQGILLSAIQQLQTREKEPSHLEMSKVTGDLGLPPEMGS